MEDVSAMISKSGKSTGDFVLQVTLTLHSFAAIPNALMCREKQMAAVVEGCRPYCSSSGASAHGKPSETTTTSQARTTAAVAAQSKRTLKRPLTEAGRRCRGGKDNKLALTSALRRHSSSNRKRCNKNRKRRGPSRNSSKKNDNNNSPRNLSDQKRQ